MMRLPCSLSSSSRSAMSLTTMAVLLIASAPDSATAVCQPMFQYAGNSRARSNEPPIDAAMVSSTCNMPKPNTWRRMARNLGRLNSSPIANMRNTTPNSPRCRTPAESCASASACGPISTPAAR